MHSAPRSALAESLEGPVAAVTADAGKNDAGMRTRVGDVETGEFAACTVVNDTAESVGDLLESLTPEAVHSKHQRFDLRRKACKVDRDALIVAITLACKIVTAVTDRAIFAAQLPEPHLVDHLPTSIEREA